MCVFVEPPNLSLFLLVKYTDFLRLSVVGSDVVAYTQSLCYDNSMY